MAKFKILWIISLFVKLIVSAILPLSADEAYYWVWSKNLQLSYYDHPPMIAWIFKFGEVFEPFFHAVRWPGVLLGHITLYLWLLIFKPTLDDVKLQLWLVLVLFSPLLGFGSIIMTPDIPVLFFWSLSLFFTLRALNTQSAADYFLTGLSLGFGFCSKYHIVLFIPSLILFLHFERKWAAIVWKKVSYTIGAGLLASLPVVLWNANNNFESIRFQLRHGLEYSQYDPLWTLSYVIGELLLIFPMIFWCALKSSPPAQLSWLKYFAWPPILFFFFTSFRASTELNWPIIAFPSILGLALFHRNIMIALKSAVVFFASLFLLVFSSIFFVETRKLHGKIEEPYALKELSALVTQYQPLYADSYQVASSLWYFSKTPVYKLKDMSRYDFFDTLSEAVPKENKFFLLQKVGNQLPKWISTSSWSVNTIRNFDEQYILLEFNRL